MTVGNRAVAGGVAIIREDYGALVFQRPYRSSGGLAGCFHGGKNVSIFSSEFGEPFFVVFDLGFYSGCGFRVRHADDDDGVHLVAGEVYSFRCASAKNAEEYGASTLFRGVFEFRSIFSFAFDVTPRRSRNNGFFNALSNPS